MEKHRLEPFWFTLLHKEDPRQLWHPEVEILFLLRGTGKVYFSDLKTAYPLVEKDIFVVNSFEVQDFELDGDSVALSFSLSPGYIHSVMPELLKYRIGCRSFIHMEDNQAAFHILRRDLAQLFQAMYKKENAGTGYLKSIAVAILEDLNRYFLDTDHPIEGGVQESLKKISNYIQEHFQERITLDDLAKHTYLSKTYISRSFTRYYGISFTGYLELQRLSHAIRLLAGQGALTDVAEESGFPNINAMIHAFKRYRGTTPGEYRRSLNQRKANSSQESDFPDEGSGLFASLLSYLSAAPAQPATERVQEVTVDTAGKKEPISQHWKRLLSIGYARSLTDGTIQRELRYIQERIGFEYLRIKGVLDDEMCLLRLDMNGNPVVNFAYLDEVTDLILSVGAKPMLELSFMPSLLAKESQARAMRGWILSAPRDISRWRELIFQLMTHLVQRYGQKTVATWLFSPWLSPDFVDLGGCTWEEYVETYTASYDAIRCVLPDALIVGPGSSPISQNWSRYLEMCRKYQCMPDILSFRSFATAMEDENSGINLIGNNESFSFAVSGDEDILAHSTARIREYMQREGLDAMPLVLEEWNSSIWQRDLCNDTCYKSAYLFKNILENNRNLNAMGYFALNDRLDEAPPSAETFHGGFGLFTQDDIPKSACLAMELLSHMGDRLLGQGDGYLVSRKGSEIQIFLYHYSHYDLLYRYRHVANMTKTSRDNVFVSRQNRAFYIRLKNLPEGTYQVSRYGITPHGGSAYDAWVRMDAPSPMNQEEREMLRRLAIPQYHSQRMHTEDGALPIKASLTPQDVWLIRIKMQ